jgi:aryl-alcohol dehydrogenase-like predicted oxidoreductase
MMEYASLGSTDLVVSRIGFGCEPLGGTDWGQFDEQQAAEAVKMALDLGINFFDTADVYGLGRSEEVLSRTLGNRRHQVIIATKFGLAWEAHPRGMRAKTWLDCSPRRVTDALEQSLRRLRLDCIPLYLIHWPDPKTPVVDTMDALQRCREAGKLRQVGVSNFPLHLVCEADRVMHLAAVELQYSLIDRRFGAGVLPHCKDHGIGVLAYGTLAQGLLSGKYGSSTVFGTDDRRHRLPHFQGEALGRNLSLVERLKRVGEPHHRSPSQVAIRWVLDHPAVCGAIVGAKSPVQVKENVGATGWRLEEEEWAYIARGSQSAP